MLELKRWERVEYAETADNGAAQTQLFSMELERLRRSDAQILRRHVAKAYKPLNDAVHAAANDPTIDTLGVVLDFFDAFPAQYLETCFAKHVRKVEGLSIDGANITTGAELFEIADNDLVRFVITHLARLAGVTPVEGKGSGSRSGSQLPVATPVIASTATSTEPVAGIVH